jgi:catechol 2,3-dioxygenase-like lactoylglutathione lyase family enzyme
MFSEALTPPRIQHREHPPMVTTTTAPRFGFALEYVKDIEATRKFYVNVLGMEVEREAPVFVQFRDRGGASYAIASDAAMSNNATLELYWLVDDAEAAYQDVSSKAEVVMPLKQEAFGKVFGVKDPAGQPRYLIELAENRPSRAVGDR